MPLCPVSRSGRRCNPVVPDLRTATPLIKCRIGSGFHPQGMLPSCKIVPAPLVPKLQSDASRSPRRAAMRWGEGDNWSLDLDMPGGSYDFKFVVQCDSSVAEASEWEAGANRFTFVSPSVFMPTAIFICFVVSPPPAAVSPRGLACV